MCIQKSVQFFVAYPEYVFWCLNKHTFQCSFFYFGLILAEEMIYDDVENGDDGGNSSLEYGWSSSEFESYEEQSDSECKNGIPSSFLRGNHKRHVCILQCCSVTEVVLVSNTSLSHLYFFFLNSFSNANSIF